MRRSFLWAGAFALAVALWFGAPYLTGKDSEKASVSGDAVRNGQEEKAADALFRVRVAEFTPQPYSEFVLLHGRTQASRSVDVRARTSGIVESSPLSQGERVAGGDLLCALDMTSRTTQLAEAKAALASARRDYEATRALITEDFASRTALASQKARLDAARARLEQIEYDITWTRIRSPLDGVVADRPAEEGQFLQTGQLCARVIALDPIFVIAQLGERHAGRIALGSQAEVKLVTGEAFSGRLRFIAPEANPGTRTFRIEVEAVNADHKIRDGITAQITFPLSQTQAYLVPASLISINDDGVIGVHAVDAQNIVRFTPVSLLEETREGIWVAGLEGAVRLITLGQHYVLDGETVIPVEDPESTGTS